MRIERLLLFLKNILYYRFKFSFLHPLAIIRKPLQIDGGQNIEIGRVYVSKHSWLAAENLTDSSCCKLEIHNGCTLGHYNHIHATGHIILEESVLTADKVYISDNQHGYENVNIPVKNQPVKQNGRVIIGTGSWLGENVCVLGASIGKHCVVGANSVVTHDIPDYCVVVGSPAFIIKRYNFETNTWGKTDKKGEFLKNNG